MKNIVLWMNKHAEQILKRCPEVLFGRTSVIHDHYRSIYGQKDWAEFVHRSRLQTAQRYSIVIIIILIVAAVELMSIASGPVYIETIRRPSQGEVSFQKDLIAIASFEGREVQKETSIFVAPAELTEQEKRQKLKEYMRNLPQLILGENSGLNRIASDVFLPDEDADTDIMVEWISDHPGLIDEKGHLDSLSAREGGTVNLTAILSFYPLEEEITIPLIVPPSEAKDHTRAIESRVVSIVESLELSMNATSTTDDFYHLPLTAGDGISIRWKQGGRGDNGSYLLITLMLLLLVVFSRRYVGIKRKALATSKSMIADFPDLLFKLVLLLNAGMVTESSIRKIAYDYERTRDHTRVKPLYEGLVELNKRISETNSSLILELRELAFMSGIRELSRFARIVEDNLNKGSTLVEKLEGEVAILWMSRKKRAEEKARLAETKLTLPLLLLLAAMIIITTAPVLITM